MTIINYNNMKKQKMISKFFPNLIKMMASLNRFLNYNNRPEDISHFSYVL